MIYYYWDKISGNYLCLDCNMDSVVDELYERDFPNFTVVPFRDEKSLKEFISLDADRFYYFEVD